jgi:hypothetical protein
VKEEVKVSPITPSFTNAHHLPLDLVGTVWEDALVRIVEAER